MSNSNSENIRMIAPIFWIVWMLGHLLVMGAQKLNIICKKILFFLYQEFMCISLLVPNSTCQYFGFYGLSVAWCQKTAIIHHYLCLSIDAHYKNPMLLHEDFASIKTKIWGQSFNYFHRLKWAQITVASWLIMSVAAVVSILSKVKVFTNRDVHIHFGDDMKQL